MTEENTSESPEPTMRSVEGQDGDRRASLLVERLTQCQGSLFGYIYSVTADAELAKDILQETNRQLWRRATEYDECRDFLPWAITHAYNQIRTFRSRQKRDRLVFESDETLQAVTERYSERETGPSPGKGDRQVALELCMQKLTEDQRSLLDRHYRKGETLNEIADGAKRRANTIAVTLHRIRQALADCINRTLSQQSPS